MKSKYLLLSLVLLLTACSKPESKGTPVADIMSQIQATTNFTSPVTEDLSNQKSAESIGISPDDISEGILYYSSDESKVDKVILVKAKKQDRIEPLENALGAEIIGLTDSWSNNDAESKKIEQHLLKTKDDYIILAVADNVDNIEKIFDSQV